jgi:hypothetical protein
MVPVLVEQRSPEKGVVQMRAEMDIVSSAAAFGSPFLRRNVLRLQGGLDPFQKIS